MTEGIGFLPLFLSEQNTFVEDAVTGYWCETT